MSRPSPGFIRLSRRWFLTIPANDAIIPTVTSPINPRTIQYALIDGRFKRIGADTAPIPTLREGDKKAAEKKAKGEKAKGKKQKYRRGEVLYGKQKELESHICLLCHELHLNSMS